MFCHHHHPNVEGLDFCQDFGDSKCISIGMVDFHACLANSQTCTRATHSQAWAGQKDQGELLRACDRNQDSRQPSDPDVPNHERPLVARERQIEVSEGQPLLKGVLREAAR